MGFPERLKELRLKKGLTQKEVAEEFGIKQPNYQQWGHPTSGMAITHPM